jgi:hypothetical protein
MADEASQRESWWVLQAQSGSHEALNELFRNVQEPLFRYIVSLVRDQHQTEDILQEVFIRIYRKLHSKVATKLRPREPAPNFSTRGEVKCRTVQKNSSLIDYSNEP